jgi:hypothetical protein
MPKAGHAGTPKEERDCRPLLEFLQAPSPVDNVDTEEEEENHVPVHGLFEKGCRTHTVTDKTKGAISHLTETCETSI